MTPLMPFHRTPPPAAEPDDEPDPLDEVTLEVTIRGLNRLLRSAALDALLDDYLATHGPRPEEENDDPALDHQ